MMLFDSLFFPELERREQYSVKESGEYYADYSIYRQEIREDCLGRCVYCDVHENENGGEETMQLDHFRPRAYEEYRYLINDPTNLVWSCPGCNRLKSNNWPALGAEEAFLGEEGFIDVFEESRNDYFYVYEDGSIESIKVPAQYIISLLALNRQSRKRCRELRWLKWKWIQRVDEMIAEFRGLKEQLNGKVDDENLLEALETHERKLVDFKKYFPVFLDFNLY